MTEIKDVVQLAAETSMMPDSLQLEISVSFLLVPFVNILFSFSFHLLCVFIRFFYDIWSLKNTNHFITS